MPERALCLWLKRHFLPHPTETSPVWWLLQSAPADASLLPPRL